MKITLTDQQTTKTLIHKLGVATSPRGNKINIKGCETIHGSGKQRGETVCFGFGFGFGFGLSCKS